MVGPDLGKCEWVWEEKLNPRWWNSRWLPSSSWVRMNEFESDWISLSQSHSGVSVFEWIWEKKTRCLNPTWQKLNPRWQNSRWPPSSSWVRMNEFESDLISLSQSGVRVFLSESERRKQGVWIQHGRIQDGCHHQVELEWMSEVFLIQHGRIQDGCHHQVEWEWMSEVLLCKWWGGKCEWSFFFVQMVGTNLGKCEWVWEEKLRWQNSRWLPLSSWVRMNEFESDWISLSQSQRGGRVFWVNLREDNKVSESKMVVSESNMAEFKMAAIIKLSQNEWVKVFFVQMVGTNLGKCEWVWEEKLRWLNPRWQNSRWLPLSSWVRMNEFESDWISLSQSQSGGRVFLSESERR